MQVRLQLLGPVQASSADPADGARSLVTQPRRVALLAYLTIARPRGMHSRDTLIALFWPESNQSSGRHALRNALHALRQSLGDGVIVAAGDNLVGVDPCRIECDVMHLESCLASGRTDEVVELYQAPLMSGFHVSDAPAFERWLDSERDRIEAAVLSAAWAHARVLRERGDLDAATKIARRATEISPDHEPSIRKLIEFLGEAGDKAGALNTYDAYATRLQAEYGAAPEPETTAAVASLRARIPTQDAEAYVLYVRGTYLFLRGAHGGFPEELVASRAFFERALERDPQFAPAYAGLSNYYSLAGTRGLGPFDEYFEKAIRLSYQALELDPALAIPHVHFGVKALYLEQDWVTAGREFATAAQLDPRYAEARRFCGVFLAAMGHIDEGIEEIRAACELEPDISIFRNALGATLMAAGRTSEAIVELRKSLQIDPAYGPARDRLLRCYESLGRYDEAVELRHCSGMPDATDFAIAYATDGDAGYSLIRRIELERTIETLESRVGKGAPSSISERMNPPQVPLAIAYVELGDLDSAFRWEQQACQAQPGLRPWFVVQSALAPLASRRTSLTSHKESVV